MKLLTKEIQCTIVQRISRENSTKGFKTHFSKHSGWKSSKKSHFAITLFKIHTCMKHQKSVQWKSEKIGKIVTQILNESKLRQFRDIFKHCENAYSRGHHPYFLLSSISIAAGSSRIKKISDPICDVVLGSLKGKNRIEEAKAKKWTFFALSSRQWRMAP